jgi:hypothetical protein
LKVRIDGTTSPIDPQNYPDQPIKPAGAKPFKHRDDAALLTDDPEVRYLYEKYAQQAGDTEELDARAVAEAREALQAGTLDTPEAIRRAGEVILDHGV